MTESFWERELAPRRLAFWIFWFISHTSLFIYGYFKQKNDRELDVLNVIGPSVWASRGAGLCLAYDGSLILLPLLRNIISYLRLTFLNRIIPVDENLWFHRQCAYSMLLFTLIHTFSHYINFWKVEQLQYEGKHAWQVHYTTWAGVTGHLMLLIMLLIYTSAHRNLRRQSFETFWYTHHLAFFFMMCLYLHAHGCFVKTMNAKCKPYHSWWFTIWSGSLYFIERVVREIRSRQPTKLIKVISHPANVIELRFEKPSFKYRAGQYLFLNVPKISHWQWHPFTITSAPPDPYISLHIRQVGDFTNALGDILNCKDSKEKATTIDTVLPHIRVDGPFGTPSEDVFKNEIAILIGGGIGITPFASILKSIWYQHKNHRPSKLQHIELFWISRDTGSFEWFQSLLKTLEETQMKSGFLTFHIYLTSKLRHSVIQNIIINDVSNSYDPLTELSSRTHYGRPNFNYIFEQIKGAIQSGEYLAGRECELKTNIGVYYCGPNSLGKTVKFEAKKATDEDVVFNFYKEHF